MFDYNQTTKEKVFEMIQITIGVILVSIGFYYFYKPIHLVTGGVSGTSIIFEHLTNASISAVSIFILIANIILLILGGVVLGKTFFYKTVYGTIALPVFIYILGFTDEYLLFNKLSTDYNLIIISTVGALLTGVGLGLVFKNNATTGGTDVLQRILHEKLKVPFSIAIYLTDGVIIAIGLFVFNVELTYFAIVSIIIAGNVVDRVMLSGKSGYTVFIITNEFTLLKNEIYTILNRGLTKVPVEGGFSESPRDMIICTISRNQLYDLKAIINENDPHAFTFITKTTESVGQGF